MTSGKTIIIYTDLDGTLLDHATYSFAESLPALAAAQTRDIPVVFCSSKTRAEMRPLRRLMQVRDPFIVENGGAVIVPAGYFPFLSSNGAAHRNTLIALGTPYWKLMEKMHELRAAFPDQIIGFSDMTAEELAQDCGLTLEAAQRAKQREFDEPFRLVNDDPETISNVLDAIRQMGLFCSRGGRYYHLHGHNDKGAAVRLLNRLYRKAGQDIFTVGLGDSLNDLPMLATVDHPVLVRKPDGRHDELVVKLLPQVQRADGIGPRGWREEVTRLLKDVADKQ